MNEDDQHLKVLLRPEEAAARLSVGRTHVYELLRNGKLASIKVGRLRRVPVGALEQFVADAEAAAVMSSDGLEERR